MQFMEIVEGLRIEITERGWFFRMFGITCKDFEQIQILMKVCKEARWFILIFSWKDCSRSGNIVMKAFVISKISLISQIPQNHGSWKIQKFVNTNPVFHKLKLAETTFRAQVLFLAYSVAPEIWTCITILKHKNVEYECFFKKRHWF